MQLFAGFMQQLGSARAGATDQVSEVDLSDAHDLRASLTGFQAGTASAASSASADSAGSGASGSSLESSAESWGDADAPILVHFGDSDFEAKYQTLIDKMAQWRATAGRVESVDLRFNGEAVVNSDTPVSQHPVVAQRVPVARMPAAVPRVTKQVPPQKHAAKAAKHTT
jgi:hypothetical protein